MCAQKVCPAYREDVGKLDMNPLTVEAGLAQRTVWFTRRTVRADVLLVVSHAVTREPADTADRSFGHDSDTNASKFLSQRTACDHSITRHIERLTRGQPVEHFPLTLPRTSVRYSVQRLLTSRAALIAESGLWEPPGTS